MARIRDILPAVIALRSGTIDQALSIALKHADDDELRMLGHAMLERGKSNGVEALIERYDRLPRDLQHSLIARAEQFSTSIRRSTDRREPQTALNALEIIEQSASTRLAYLVTALCRHGEPKVREQAGRSIVAMTTRAASSQEPGHAPHLDAISTAYLVEAVEQAIVLYSRHDEPALINAMLWLMPRPLPEARAALSQPEHSAVQPMNKFLRERPGPAGRRGLFAWIGVRPVSDACRDALAEANADQQLDQPLQFGHLIALPGTRRELRRARRPETLWPSERQQAAMPGQAQRWLPAYLQALTQDTMQEVARLGALAHKTEPATRLAVLRRLLVIARSKSADDQPAANNAKDTLALLTRDPEPAIARTALWHLIHTDYAGLSRILADLVNSRHAAVRKVAAKHLAPLGFDRFWKAWPKLDSKRRLAAGRALIKIDEEFHRHLANRLASHEPETRLRALVIIAALNQGCFFEDVLLDLCGSSDKHVVASAIKALSGCTSEAAQKTLELAMDHDDARIRANAIEAISQTQAAANLDKLLVMSQDTEQRPRTNAIKALLELQAKDALPSLTRMLTDRRPQHRISALWLIDELGILQLARMVAEISLSDDDKYVKNRASSVIQHLIEDLEQQAGDKQPTEAA